MSFSEVIRVGIYDEDLTLRRTVDLKQTGPGTASFSEPLSLPNGWSAWTINPHTKTLVCVARTPRYQRRTSAPPSKGDHMSIKRFRRRLLSKLRRRRARKLEPAMANRLDKRYDKAGTASALMSAHVAAVDPHGSSQLKAWYDRGGVGAPAAFKPPRWELLHEYVRHYGPSCPDFGCEHEDCAAIRAIRAAAEASNKKPVSDFDREHIATMDAAHLDREDDHAKLTLVCPTTLLVTSMGAGESLKIKVTQDLVGGWPLSVRYGDDWVLVKPIVTDPGQSCWLVIECPDGKTLNCSVVPVSVPR